MQRMSHKTQKQIVGDRGEDIACEYLVKNGYRIIERNFRIKGGEIDIIARQNGELVFIEVKTRKQTLYGYPEEAVTIHKLKRITKAIKQYLLKSHVTKTYIRFDIISIELQTGVIGYTLNHLKNVELKENFI